MDKKTIRLIKYHSLYKNTNKEALRKAKTRSSQFVSSKINRILGLVRYTDPNWGMKMKNFTTEFRNVEDAKLRLDEIVVTYLSFVAHQVAEDKYNRSFLQPGLWKGERNLQLMFKILAECILTLVYNLKEIRDPYLFDVALTDALLGRPDAIRKLVSGLGIQLSQDSFP